MHLALLILLTVLAGPAEQPATKPSATTDVNRIDVILQQLEDRGDTVRDLKCKVEYTIEDVIAADKYTKYGEIRYKEKKPNPVFYIHFEKMNQGGFINRNDEWYIFDGRYLWEIKEAAKNKIQHEVVPPGEQIDLFDIEESPIPIPFGQKKAQIQKNFAVVLMDPAEGDPPNTDHLVCRPKPNSRLAEDVERLDLYIDQELHLPVKMISVQRKGSQINKAVFPDLTRKSINSGLSDEAFAHPAEAKDWPTVEAEPSRPSPPGETLRLDGGGGR